jgi:DNA-directed RNA polymerase subunit K
MQPVRFETARLVGARALQISLGAPILVDPKGSFDALHLALQEYQEGLLPLRVGRRP